MKHGNTNKFYKGYKRTSDIKIHNCLLAQLYFGLYKTFCKHKALILVDIYGTDIHTDKNQHKWSFLQHNWKYVCEML